MSIETWASVGVSVATAGAGVWAARSARRTKPQERRDDFTAIATQQGAAIERLERRDRQREEDMEKQRERIADQDAALGYLQRWVGTLVGYIRQAGMEPPSPPPMPDGVRDYLDRIV
ncbi:hypothetical protein AB0C77_06500 [Streptomyces sp. NPDC048629]|uniref:hypothetical protein n=1 Tax=Streptomyces sp. NPDC048629 TaxID=3154824 RepID=UPI00343D162E